MRRKDHIPKRQFKKSSHYDGKTVWVEKFDHRIRETKQMFRVLALCQSKLSSYFIFLGASSIQEVHEDCC